MLAHPTRQIKIGADTIRNFKNYEFDRVYLRQTEVNDCSSKVLIVKLMHEVHRFYAGKAKNCDRPVFYRLSQKFGPVSPVSKNRTSSKSDTSRVQVRKFTSLRCSRDWIGTNQRQLLLFDLPDAFLIRCSKVILSFFLN
jgi:hypothetical protein